MNIKKGYIKSHRFFIDNVIFKDVYLWHLWSYIIHKVNHKPKDIVINNKVIHLKAGEGVFGLNKIVLDCSNEKEGSKGFNRLRTVYYRKLKILETMQFLKLKKTNKYTIITILYWDLLQENETQMKLKRNSNENKQEYKEENKEIYIGFYCLILSYSGLIELGISFINKWKEWLTYWKEIKKDITESTARKHLDKLNELHLLGYDVLSVIDEAIYNNWRGFYPGKQEQQQILTGYNISNFNNLLGAVNEQ